MTIQRFFLLDASVALAKALIIKIPEPDTGYESQENNQWILSYQ